MTKKKFIIAIIREARADENRSPITPKQAQTLISKYPIDVTTAPIISMVNINDLF